MVHQSMNNDSRIVKELYIKIGCSMLEDLVVIALYFFYWIPKEVTTMKQLRPFESSECLKRTSTALCPVL